MIKYIVFDMGQVLLQWNPSGILSDYELTGEERNLLLRELFQSVEWLQLDHGTLSEKAAIDQVCTRLPEKLHSIVSEIVTGWWKKPLSPVPRMADLVRELKEKGYGIYLLSNAGTALRNYFHRIPGSECFDGLMVSAEEKMIKPQYEIFHALFQTFSLQPENCYFVDDSPANIESAQCCGMAGTIFRGDVDRLRREMAAAGIDI